MSIEVKFGRLASSYGRNGNIKTSGLEIWFNKYDRIVSVSPLTSRGAVGNCVIQVPLEHIDEFIHQLELLRYEDKDSL